MPLDIGVGILLSFLVGHFFGVHITPLLILLGVVFALLPDIDILPFLWPSAHNHRSFLHWPLLYVPAAMFVYFLFGSIIGALFALCIFAHLVHDTIGLGWGIAWFAPFSSRKYLFPDKMRRNLHGVFMSWTPKEEEEFATREHNPHWIRDFYFRPNAVAYIEYGILLIAIVVLLIYFR